MIFDGLIGLAVLAAAAAGFWRGFLQPFLVEFLFIFVLLLLAGNSTYNGLLARLLHANAVLDVFIALLLAVVAAYAGGRVGGFVRRLRQVRGPDGLVGFLLQAAVAVLASYWVLSGLVVLDRAFAPVNSLPRVDTAQVSTMNRLLLSNSMTSRLVDHAELRRLAAAAAKTGGARLDSAAELHQVQSIYEDFLRPQLVSSRLARTVMAIGQRAPRSGNVGPSALPRPTPSPTPTPGPR